MRAKVGEAWLAQSAGLRSIDNREINRAGPSRMRDGRIIEIVELETRPRPLIGRTRPSTFSRMFGDVTCRADPWVGLLGLAFLLCVCCGRMLPPCREPTGRIFTPDFIVTLRGLTRIRKSAWFRCAFCRGTARCAPTPHPAPFCSSGLCVERAPNQVGRLERRLPIFEFGFNRRSAIYLSGHRRGRRCLGSDVTEQGEKIFSAHFDASDGKCSVRGLDIRHCVLLEGWDVRR